jgi:hypothetical protein
VQNSNSESSKFSSESSDNLQQTEKEQKPSILIANDNLFLLNACSEMSERLFEVYKAENGL